MSMVSAHRRVPQPVVTISVRSFHRFLSISRIVVLGLRTEGLSIFSLSPLLFEANNMCRLTNVHKQRCARGASPSARRIAPERRFSLNISAGEAEAGAGHTPQLSLGLSRALRLVILPPSGLTRRAERHLKLFAIVHAVGDGRNCVISRAWYAWRGKSSSAASGRTYTEPRRRLAVARSAARANSARRAPWLRGEARAAEGADMEKWRRRMTDARRLDARTPSRPYSIILLFAISNGWLTFGPSSFT
ncbi:hypothetical protein K1T71_005481 [Dendrolimus kikuchii]|uniref:Uncharacterized protein n=1 Tax=Dendrolimus kikuchii TaxID=765133 RepID=A0ACC1D4D3_9NEOP|nr:hypothetical protein K1T71_005481 [Dendrolimus kikuchii]